MSGTSVPIQRADRPSAVMVTSANATVRTISACPLGVSASSVVLIAPGRPAGR
ncbi:MULTISPECIES: hypothetical protein [Sphingomonas]|uniref:hypothetical protein n=1 Tax=Sphingomonas TaxID=13687 RepID=UPI00223839D3|nr:MULTISPECIES: hypothetical protein [Sphingomonas]MCW6532161.1 hypothetical protein [Sphingomonas lycopersici]